VKAVKVTIGGFRKSGASAVRIHGAIPEWSQSSRSIASAAFETLEDGENGSQPQ
jgi:hypothetical protein